MNYTNVLLVMLPAIFLLVDGFWRLMGNGKAAYFARFARSGGVYASLPFAIGWLLALLPRMIFPNAPSILFYFGAGIFILGIIFAGYPPSFLKPAWLKWLEREHGDIYWILENDAHEMGLRIWQKRVKTQEGLEAWVAEVRQKHGK